MQPAVVIGPGRVGRAISSMHPTSPSLLLGRNQQLPQDFKGPVFVCTTNNALDAVLQQVQPSQYRQLIFTQNGMLLPWLRAHNLEHQTTQVLLYMSATAGGQVTDGGRSCACGPLAHYAAQLLRQGGVACTELDSWQAYHQEMLIKLLWSSIFWLISAGLGGATVGSIVQQHAEEVEALTADLLPIGQQYILSCAIDQQPSPRTAAAAAAASSTMHTEKLVRTQQQQHGQLLLPDVLSALKSYSLAIAEAVPSVEMARQEFAWRNGFFLQQQATPLHVEWLVRAGCQDLLPHWRQ